MAASLDALLREAIRRNARDLHLDPQPDGTVMLRHRIEGNLVPGEVIPAGAWDVILGQIFRDADLDEAERRLPQDGLLRLDDRTYGVSLMPTVNGTSVTIAHFDLVAERGTHLDELGYAPDDLARIKDALGRSGIVYFTGPTGCGSHSS